jgi:ribosome-binding protein aMBF1 (putative translation factor)
MIANERQYRTRAAARDFEALTRYQTVEAHRSPDMRRDARGTESQRGFAMRWGVRGVAKRQGWRSGTLVTGELPEALIRARIAVGLTQKRLAERLGLKEQQVCGMRRPSMLA